MASLFEKLENQRPAELRARSLDSIDWFRQNVRDIKIKGKNLQDEVDNYVLRFRQVGRMYMFFYDPKTKAKMRYWDRFPIMLTVKRYGTGWLGLNLHYIAPKYRMFLLDALYDFTTNEKYDETTRLRLTYQLIKSSRKLRWAKPCIKQYLNNHVYGRIVEVPPDKWEIVAMLPCQQFRPAGANANTVYKESRRKF